jgi:hypothetical protein
MADRKPDIVIAPEMEHMALSDSKEPFSGCFYLVKMGSMKEQGPN